MNRYAPTISPTAHKQRRRELRLTFARLRAQIEKVRALRADVRPYYSNELAQSECTVFSSDHMQMQRELRYLRTVQIVSCPR